MKSLFENISSLNVENDFEIQFHILGLKKGWVLLQKVEAEPKILNQIAKYVSYAYSFDSPLLRKKKDRLDCKLNIVTFLEIEMSELITEVIRNKNSKVNNYITWWLRESQDRKFAEIVSAEDLYFDLLQVVRDGVDITVTAKDEKQAEKVMKTFTRMEVIAKAKAYEEAQKVAASIENQTRIFEKNYDYLMGVVKEEMPDVADNLGWAERQVIKRRNK